MAPFALLRLCRPMNQYRLHCYALSRKLMNTGISSWSTPLSSSPVHYCFYSSSPARIDHAKHRRTVQELEPEPPEPEPEPEPELESERHKRLKTLSRILGDPRDKFDARLDPDIFLLKVLKRELKKAANSVQKFEVEIKGSFDPFELVPTTGTSDLTLRRRMGDEEITIKCVLQLEEPEDHEYLLEDNENELNIIQHLKMNIQIKKASSGDNTRFQLFCHYMTHSIKIEEIVYLDKSAYVENDYPYSGPLFSDLNDQMQQCFYELIKRRGIDANLADLALDHLSAKYQEEYLRWVQNIRGFIKKND